MTASLPSTAATTGAVDYPQSALRRSLSWWLDPERTMQYDNLIYALGMQVITPAEFYERLEQLR